MQLFKRKDQKGKNSSLAKVGKDPSTDWFLTLCILFILFLVIIVLTGMRFYKVNYFINELSQSTETSIGAGTKTKEEELQDIIKFYKEKENRHNQLLGKSKIEVKQNLDAIAAEAKKSTSTASSTSDTKSLPNQSVQTQNSGQSSKSSITPATKSGASVKQSTETEELQLVIPGN